MLAENLFGFPNWCGFWKWVLWTRLPTFLQSIIEKGTICSPYSWNSWIFTVFCCRLSRLNKVWRTHLAICVMHFQPPGLFKVRKQESIQFGVSSKESKIAAMECSYLCTCVFASSTKLQPWSAHTCAHACACIVNQIAAMESSYLLCVCLNCLLNSSHGLRYLCICVCYCQPPNCSGVWWARLGQKLVSKWSKYCDR